MTFEMNFSYSPICFMDLGSRDPPHFLGMGFRIFTFFESLVIHWQVRKRGTEIFWKINKRNTREIDTFCSSWYYLNVNALFCYWRFLRFTFSQFTDGSQGSHSHNLSFSKLDQQDKFSIWLEFVWPCLT